MTFKIPPCFSDFEEPPGRVQTSPEWHYKAWVLWNILPPQTSINGMGWLLGKGPDSIESLARHSGWKARRTIRAESKEAERLKKREACKPVVKAIIKANDVIFEGDIPRVSMVRLVKFIEYKAELAAKEDNPTLMNTWLVSLAGVDGAMRARKIRQLDKIKKDSVKIYLPEQDPTPSIDIEDAKVVPPPVEF